MNQELIQNLLADLKNADTTVRERAGAQLWRIWFWQKGRSGLAQIEAIYLILTFFNIFSF